MSPLQAVVILRRTAVPRYFNLREAEALLPKVERALQNLRDYKLSYEGSDAQLNQIAQRVALIGGMVPPRERIVELRAQKEASARGLKHSMEQFEQLGCLLKDLDSGLVDFPTLYRGKEVYLCWKLGETGITFWHHVEDGFRGRKRIDSEFLSNHTGEG
jgi:hypothetical protein